MSISNDVYDRRKKYRRANSLTDLHEAVLKNCEYSVQYAIASGVPIDLVDHAEKTPLYYACERGFIKISQILLEHGARHNILDLNQTSPLWIAAREGYDKIVLILLNKGADVNQKAHDGTTALYQASYEGHVKCVYHLISSKACVHSAKNSGATPLFVAARNGHHRIVKCLLKKGANPCQSQEDLRSPLHTALLYNRVRCIRIFLKTNIDYLLYQSDIYGWNHLHFLAKRGNMKSARIFFHYLKKNEKIINLNEKDVFGNTCLHIAIFNKKIKFAQYLIKKGVNIHQPNSFGWTYQNYLLKKDEESEINETLTKFYLNNLLSKHVLHYTIEEELMCNEIEAYVNELVSYVEKLNPLFRNNIIRSGSFYERTRVGLPDEFDYMINLNEFERLCTFIENDFDPSGYGRLYPKLTEEAQKNLSYYIEPITQCISSEKIRKQFYQLLTSARAHVICKNITFKFQHLKFEWTSGDKRCGTAIHAEWYGIQYPYLSIKIDVVPCLTIYSWPKKANIPCPLEKFQFNIIARSPKLTETYLWRISTSYAELIYFQKLIPEQINGYLTLKILRQTNPFNCKVNEISYTSDDLITSYMLKNEFLYQIIKYPQKEQWIKGNLIHRVLRILKHLHKHLRNGLIQSYYIKNYNVIDNDDYKNLRSFEIKYSHILLSEFKQKVKEIHQKSKRRHTFTAIEPIIQKNIPRQRAFSMNI